MKRSLDRLFASARDRVSESPLPSPVDATDAALGQRMRHAVQRVVAWFTEY